MTGGAVVGPLTGSRLGFIPTEVTTWKRWRKAHPKTTVLEPPLPLEAYRRTNRGYALYRRKPRPRFPTGPKRTDPRYPPKTPCTIVFRNNKPRCYPHPELREGETRDGDLRLRRKGKFVTVHDAKGALVPSMTGYWFAWCAFYPKGTVYTPKRSD